MLIEIQILKNIVYYYLISVFFLTITKTMVMRIWWENVFNWNEKCQNAKQINYIIYLYVIICM